MRILRNFVLTVLGLLLLLFVAVQLFGDPIAARVVASLNERFPTKIEVDEYDLSLLRSFPHLSVDLHGVNVQGSDGHPLLQADRVGCLLDLGSLFGKTRIKGFRVDRGNLWLLTDVDGNTNYQVAGYTPVGDAGGGGAGKMSVSFAVEQAHFNEVHFQYDDRQLRTQASVFVETGRLTGDFSAEQYTLNTDASLRVEQVDLDGTRYVGRESLELSGQTTIDNLRGSYTFSPLRLSVRDLEVSATGSLTPTEAGLSCDLRLSSATGSLEDVVALLPATVTGTIAEWDTEGDLSLAATITGNWTQTDYPRIDGELGFSDGRIGSPRINLGARDIELRATFAYLDGPRGGVQTFAVDEFSGTFRGEPFRMRFSLEDLKDPVIDFSADGSLPLATLPAFLPDDRAMESDGMIYFTNLRLKGRYADMIEARRMGRVSSVGIVQVEDGKFVVNDRQLNLPTGVLKLSDNRLKVENLRVVAESSDFVLNGETTNYLPVLLADSLNSKDASLKFVGSMQGDKLSIDDMLALFTSSEADQAAADEGESRDSLTRRDIARRARITDLLDGSFEAAIRSWQWDRMEGQDFRGQLEFYRGQLEIRGITDAMDGQFRVDASTFFRETTHSKVRLSASDIDAPTFFYQLEDFEQEVLTADNIQGRMNANLLLDLYYDELGNFDYERFTALAALEIGDGELRDFELLENFAFALKSGDLERVRFTRLSNYFEIKDRTIYIPAMFIQSSAINLTLSGSHTFDQYLEYYIRVNAGQVVANKIARHDRSLDPLPARNGFFNLYYTIEGPLDSYRVETDKQAVKADFRRSEYRRNRIRSRLAAAFDRPIMLLDDNEGENDAGE
ncbi:AsmA-like C-terminal region-containing protein [Lewinella sp. IMCC34191]|uniref:AsmA-like C-terminal region-containing protein n=1 Tax=Lewinella sp. IMCC34191 TaxID=2259172 RepID=UPI000E24BBE3|nr:AsmA-like C-terminal region-containing protein [Lewinella sp. IMCC34191]